MNNPLYDNIYTRPQNKVRHPEPGEPLKIEVQDYQYFEDSSTINQGILKKGQNGKGISNLPSYLVLYRQGAVWH